MMIGDALRGEYPLSRDFSQRVTQRLAQEPTVFAPRRSAVRGITAYALSAAASLSAIALLGWIAFFINPLTPSPKSPKPRILTRPQQPLRPSQPAFPATGKRSGR